MAVKKLVGKLEKVGEKVEIYTWFWLVFKIAQKNTRVLLVDLHRVLHELSIDFFLDFFNLVAESKVKF